MNELVKYEPKYGLTFKQQVTYAQQHSMVKDVDEDLLSNIINRALGKSIQFTGFKMEDDDFDFLLAGMTSEISSHAKGMRVSEIPIAFDRGIKKVYGEWIGLSVVTFTGFIHSFLKDPEYLKIKRELEPEKKKLPAKQFDGQKRFDDLKKEFDEKGTCEDIGNLVYDWLIGEGKIEKGYGNQFYEQAKVTLIEMQKHLLKDEKNKFIRQSVTSVLHQIESNSSSLIIVLAKKIAVNHYLKNQILVK